MISRIQTIKELDKFQFEKDTLVFVDVDNTTVWPANPDSPATPEAVKVMIKECGHAIGITKCIQSVKREVYVPVEGNATVEALQSLSKKCYVLFCTKRSPSLQEATEKHLECLKDVALKANIEFEIGSICRNGVIYCGEYSKKKTIMEYIKSHHMAYKNFYVVDDEVDSLDFDDKRIHVIEYVFAKSRQFDRSKVVFPKFSNIIGIGGDERSSGIGKDLFHKCLGAVLDSNEVVVCKFATMVKVFCSIITKTSIKDNYCNKSLVPIDNEENGIVIEKIGEHLQKIGIKMTKKIEDFLTHFRASLPLVTLGTWQQLIGNGCRDAIASDIWIRFLDYEIGTYPSETIKVITDGRFRNEVDWMESRGVCLINLRRPRDLALPSLCGRNEDDVSEKDLVHYGWKFPFRINNFSEKKYKLMKEVELLFPKKLL